MAGSFLLAILILICKSSSNYSSCTQGSIHDFGVGSCQVTSPKISTTILPKRFLDHRFEEVRLRGGTPGNTRPEWAVAMQDGKYVVLPNESAQKANKRNAHMKPHRLAQVTTVPAPAALPKRRAIQAPRGHVVRRSVRI